MPNLSHKIPVMIRRADRSALQVIRTDCAIKTDPSQKKYYVRKKFFLF